MCNWTCLAGGRQRQRYNKSSTALHSIPPPPGRGRERDDCCASWTVWNYFVPLSKARVNVPEIVVCIPQCVRLPPMPTAAAFAQVFAIFLAGRQGKYADGDEDGYNVFQFLCGGFTLGNNGNCFIPLSRAVSFISCFHSLEVSLGKRIADWLIPRTGRDQEQNSHIQHNIMQIFGWQAGSQSRWAFGYVKVQFIYEIGNYSSS